MTIRPETMMEIVVSAADEGIRLDAFFAREAEISRSRAAALMESGLVFLNGAPPKKAGVSLKEGDSVRYQIPEAVPAKAVAQDIPLRILYQDDDIVVVDKPRGMVVHPAAGHAEGTLVNALLAACENLSGIGGELRPGIVHRLDKDTTGLLVAAKNDLAHQALSEQMKAKTAGREYLALARGRFSEERGRVSLPIGRHPRDRKKMAVVPNGREAATNWERLSEVQSCTLLRLRLETGRTHQIRVHLSHLNHPLFGDPIYGWKEDKTPILMLHARVLTFDHPRNRELMRFETPPPEDFIDVLSKKGLCVLP